MYRAGFQVSALDCDYESAKNLGLICPFCKEAVFWRKGSDYERTGQKISTSANFAHYNSDDPMAQQCELRAKRREGREYLERLEIESKNQRLKLFNEHLWTMFASQIGISKKELSKVRKYFGKARVAKFARETTKCWQRREADGLNYADVDKALRLLREKQTKLSLRFPTLQRTEIQAKSSENHNSQLSMNVSPKIGPTVGYVSTPAFENFSELLEFTQGLDKETMRLAVNREGLKTHITWLSGIDGQLHLAICKEICSFLGTRTAGYVMEKLCVTCLRDLRNTYSELHPFHIDDYEGFSNEIMVRLAGYISSADWIEEIKERGNWQAP